MDRFELNYKGIEYTLSEENSTYVDDEVVKGFGLNETLALLNEGKEKVDFDYAYYEGGCPECGGGKNVDGRHFGFLEFHIYIYTKNGQYVISNISEEYEKTSCGELSRQGKIDSCFIVSIIFCDECKTYSIEIEECDM